MQDENTLISIFHFDGRYDRTKPRKDIRKGYDVVGMPAILLCNSLGNLYLTRVQQPPDINYPVRWGMSAAGLIRHRETPLDAAKRTLERELGISSVDIVELAGRKYFDKFRKHIWMYLVQTDSEPKPNPDDFTEARWFSLQEAYGLVLQKQTTPTLEPLLRKYEEFKQKSGKTQ